MASFAMRSCTTITSVSSSVLAMNRTLTFSIRASAVSAGSVRQVYSNLSPGVIKVEHTAYPEAQMEHLSKGWQENYIEPLRKMFS